MTRPPTHDASGLNIVDPNDTLGLKTEYITTLQRLALMRYVPRGDSSNSNSRAVDVGCGFGRLTPFLFELGYGAVCGVDPDPRSLAAGRELNPGPAYVEGGLPDLPMEEGSVDLMLLHNLIRPLKVMGQVHRVDACRRFLSPHGRLVVVDNVWPGRDDYLRFDELVEPLTSQGLRLERWCQIRRARWWMIFPIRYGLVPRRMLRRIAEHELKTLAKRRRFSRWQYINTLLVFGHG